MKFLSLFVAAVAATRLRSRGVTDDITPANIMTHCDDDQSASISKKEAHDCLNRYFVSEAKRQSKPIHDMIDEYWPMIAGADGEATLTELEAAFGAASPATTALAQNMKF